MASLIGDVKFSAEMYFELLESYDKESSDELCSFKDDERLECLSSDDITTRLYKSFNVDVEKIRSAVKNEEPFAQTELVCMANVA